MVRRLIGETACASAACALRISGGQPSEIFGERVRAGTTARRQIALTFDDGPSEATPELLRILQRFQVRATFFQCGANVRRLPHIARAVREAGHEIGNHLFSHPEIHFRSYSFILDEMLRTQETIGDVTGSRPHWLRTPLGLRWFGLGRAQRRLGLTQVMWTHGGQDWKQNAPQIIDDCTHDVTGGSILCLHDGRGLTIAPDVSTTLEALPTLLPRVANLGFEFTTLDSLLPA